MYIIIVKMNSITWQNTPSSSNYPKALMQSIEFTPKPIKGSLI